MGHVSLNYFMLLIFYIAPKLFWHYSYQKFKIKFSNCSTLNTDLKNRVYSKKFFKTGIRYKEASKNSTILSRKGEVLIVKNSCHFPKPNYFGAVVFITVFL